MAWKQFQFKDQTVFVRVLANGKPIVHRGRVEMRYRLGATKSYRAAPDNLIDGDGEIIPDEAFGGTPTPAAVVQAPRETPSKVASAATILIYTDGACSGNPGPAGIGVLLERPDGEVIEHSEFIGEGTNNIAELTAILRALEMLRPDEHASHVLLYTDSAWSLGVLVGGWKAKVNLELITAIKDRMTTMPDVELLKIKGHAGNTGNEEADAPRNHGRAPRELDYKNTPPIEADGPRAVSSPRSLAIRDASGVRSSGCNRRSAGS